MECMQEKLLNSTCFNMYLHFRIFKTIIWTDLTEEASKQENTKLNAKIF